MVLLTSLLVAVIVLSIGFTFNDRRINEVWENGIDAKIGYGMLKQGKTDDQLAALLI